MVGILTICGNEVLYIRFTRASKIEPCWALHGQIETPKIGLAQFVAGAWCAFLGKEDRVYDSDQRIFIHPPPKYKSDFFLFSFAINNHTSN